MRSGVGCRALAAGAGTDRRASGLLGARVSRCEPARQLRVRVPAVSAVPHRHVDRAPVELVSLSSVTFSCLLFVAMACATGAVWCFARALSAWMDGE